MAPAAKKRTAKKKKKETKTTQSAKKQMWAVVLFSLGILFGAITFIKGDKLWLSLHNLFFGLFGWSVYFLAPLIIYIAVIAALDKPLSSIKAKIWQVVVLIIMISGAIQIFGQGLPPEGNFVEKFLHFYSSGKTLSGGGLAGAVFAVPLINLFDKLGASIIIVLSIFVFTMLITGSTLISLYRLLKNPVEKLEEDYVQKIDNAPPVKENIKIKAPAFASKAVPKFNIDVDISRDNKTTAEVQETLEEPPFEDMPSHPIMAEENTGEIDKIINAMRSDSPTEYIAAEEFAADKKPEEENPAAPEEEAAAQEHPLDYDIEKLIRMQGGKDDFDIDLNGINLAEDNLEVVDVIAPIEESSEKLTYTQINIEEPVATRHYRYPGTGLLKLPKAVSPEDMSEELRNNAQILVDTLKSFGVQTRITEICKGPTVTRYELQPSAGVKISKITGLSDDIALNLATAGIRIEAPIPNKAAVGIEVPNKNVSVVTIRELIDSVEFKNSKSDLSVALGRDIAGNSVIADIAKMPHVLIAGATGSGKSVCINSIIISLLYRSSPNEVKLVMIDPKVVELGVYNGIPHLLVPVVTDPKKAAGALGWAVKEMLDRYRTFADNGVRDISGYNKLSRKNEELAYMPQIVIIIDELADLMMAAPNEVEDSICRLAQMARAAGMHLVIATQRPSVDVITGVIKANIPSRVAFAVSSQVDSRTILDMGGAEKLLGRGDMLFYPVGASKPVRVQGCFVTDTEVESVVTYIKQTDTAEYDQEIVDEIDRQAVTDKKSSGDGGGFDDEDDMLPQAIECVIEMGQASTSMLQRKLRLGYARAARIIDQLEERGIVGPFEGSKPREVTITKDQWIEMKLAKEIAK